MSKVETLENPRPTPEFASSFFSQHPAFVDLTLFPDGIPCDPQETSGTRMLDMGTVLFLGKLSRESGEEQARFAFPEAPEATEFTLDPNTFTIAFPRLPQHQVYEMVFHSRGVDDSLNGEEPIAKPFSMGPVILEGLVKNDQGVDEVVVVYPEKPDQPFTMPTELVTFSPALKRQNESHS